MGTLTVNATNGQTVAAGASYTVPYPAGKSAGSYLTEGAKITTSDGSIYDAQVSIGASSITITNPTGRAISSGGFDYLDLQNAGVLASFNASGDTETLSGPNNEDVRLAQLTIDAIHQLYQASNLEQIEREIYPATLPEIPELEPVNYYTDRLFCGDATYLYGASSANQLDFVRVDILTGARTVTANPFGVSSPQYISTTFTTSVPGRIFASVGSATNLYKVWRSDDYGATWTLAISLGGGSITDVLILGANGFAEGATGWFIGEYNINGSRTPGGANDAVVIWKSTDQGLNWTADQTFNVSGSHQMRHIHGLKYTPNGLVILCGDTNAESSLILWDETTAIGNVPYASMTVPVRHGQQRYRAVDIIYNATEQKLFWMTDAFTATTTSGNDCGYFSMPADFSAVPVRIDGKIIGMEKRSMYTAAQFSNGVQCFLEGVDATLAGGGDFSLGVWTTDESRARIGRAGAVRLLTTATATAGNLFVVNDVAYVSISTFGLGKGATIGTCSFRPSATKKWNTQFADTVHPVYWINPVSGLDNTDTGRGYTPTLPWATAKYALESSRCIRGGRVIYEADTISENPVSAIAPVFATTSSETTQFTTLEGRGKDTTKLMMDAASALAFFFRAPSGVATRIRFKDMTVSNLRDTSGIAIWHGQGNALATAVDLCRARIGGYDIGYDTSDYIQPFNLSMAAGGSHSITGWRSEVITVSHNSAYLVVSDVDGPTSITATECVFSGGQGLISEKTTDSVVLDKCLINGYVVSAITSEAGASVQPIAKNTRFASVWGVPQWTNTAGMAVTAKFTGCECTATLNVSGAFDTTSVVTPNAAPVDAYSFDFRRCY